MGCVEEVENGDCQLVSYVGNVVIIINRVMVRRMMCGDGDDECGEWLC